jgi:glycosyltransferase involved in cell wall biosynthesis
MTAPRVSVVMPTRDRWPMLDQALQSVLSQEGVELEAIVVDEASSDGTPEQLTAIGDERITLIRNRTPTGPANARNAAIRSARGEWIAFLDDDDLWAPGKLRIQLERAERGGHGMSYTGRIEVDDRLVPLRTRAAADPRGLDEKLLAGNPIGGPSSVVLRREVLDRVGEFDDRLPPLEDWDLWIRASRETTWDACPELLIAYRFHAANLSTTAAERISRSYDVLAQKHRDIARATGIDFGSDWYVRWAAGQELAGGHRLRAARAYLRTAARSRRPRDFAAALAALAGGRLERLGRGAEARVVTAPDWLERYA